MGVALALVMIAVGCASVNPQVRPIVGESIVTSERAFEASAAVITPLCRQRVLAVATCDAFRDFGMRFKALYPQVVDAYARTPPDQAFTEPAGWAALVAELAQFTVIAVSFHPVTDAGVP